MPPKSIVWRTDLEGVTWEMLENLYARAPLGNKSAATLAIAFRGSQLHCIAWENGQLIAAGRALADGVDCAFLCDIAVLPEYQGQGLGQAVVQHLLAQAAGHRKIILYAAAGKEGFYQRLGFSPMKTAMAQFADPISAAQAGLIDTVVATQEFHSSVPPSV